MDGLKKFEQLGNFYFTTVKKLLSKIFIRSGKMHHVELNSGTFKSSTKSFFTFEDIALRESHAKLNKKLLNSGSRLNLNIRNQYLVFLETLTDFQCILKCLFTEMKNTFKLKHESLPKDIRQELLKVNNNV